MTLADMVLADLDGYVRAAKAAQPAASPKPAAPGSVPPPASPEVPLPTRNATAKRAGVAGLAVLAEDTGRVLMLQRALTDDDPAAGTWEFPGGHVEPGETSLDAARREWSEETGLAVPDGEVVGKWEHGSYCGYVMLVSSEDDAPIFDREDVTNPDDPDGDLIEALAWWDPDQLFGNPALRPELRDSLKAVLDALGGNGYTRATREAGGKHYLLQKRDEEGEDAGQWVKGIGMPDLDMSKVMDFAKMLSEKVDEKVDVNVDRKGVHFIIDVSGTPVPIDFTVWDFMALALSFGGGWLAAGAKAAQVAGAINKVTKIKKAQKAVKLAKAGVEAADIVAEAKAKTKRDDPARALMDILVREARERGATRVAGGPQHEWQPRNPRTGEWIDMTFGPVSMDRVTEVFGDLVGEATPSDEDYRVQARGDGRVVVLHRADDAGNWNVARHYTSDDAAKFADMIDDMANDAVDFENDDDDADPDELIDDNSMRGLADGSYVAYNRRGDVEVHFGDDDEEGRHDFGTDGAYDLATALRDMAEVVDTDVLERREREEAEREAEREALEKAANWYDDEPYAEIDRHRVGMWDADHVEIENDSPAVKEWAIVHADDLAGLALALRGYRDRAAELADTWEGEDEDGDEIDPEIEESVDVSERVTLDLLEDGDMHLYVKQEREEGKPDFTWDITVWRNEADQVADHLDRLLAKIQAAPKLPATRAHQRTEPWENQPRVPGGIGEHGGEWTDGGKVVGYRGQEGYVLDRLKDIYGHVVLDFPFSNDANVTRFAGDQIVVTNDVASSASTATPPLGREVIYDSLESDSARALADAVDEAVENYDEDTEDERFANGLTDYAITDEGILVGLDPEEGIAIGWPKVEEPDEDDLDASFHMWYLGTDDASDFAQALRDAADYQPEIVDSVTSDGGLDLHLWSDHDVQLEHGNNVLTMWHRAVETLRNDLQHLRDGDGPGARQSWLENGMHEIRRHPDGSITIGQTDSRVTIAADDVDYVIDVLGDYLIEMADRSEFEGADRYASPQSTLLETVVGQRARRIFRELVRVAGGKHWLDQLRDDEGRFAEMGGLGSKVKKLVKGKGFMHGRRPVKVRPRYAELKTTEDIQRRLQLDLRKVLRQAGGKNATVRFGDTHPLAAKEYAEGIMRVAERWPETRLDAVKLADLGGKSFGTIAVAPRSQRVTITFDEGLSRDRSRGLQRLRRGMEAGRPGDDYTYVAASLFGAAVDGMVAGERPDRDHATRAVKEHLQTAGIDVDDRAAVQAEVHAQLGDVALHSRAAAVSEALADDALHGDGASPLSQRIRAEVTRSYNDLLAGGKLVDYKHPEVKVPKGPPIVRPPAPNEMLKPFTGRKLTRLEKAQEMVASGRYSAEDVLDLLQLRIKRKPEDLLSAEEVNKLAARLIKDAKKAGGELGQDEATTKARELLVAATGGGGKVTDNTGKALKFRDALFMQHRIAELAMTSGDDIRVLKFLNRQNTSDLMGVAAIYGIKIARDGHGKPDTITDADRKKAKFSHSALVAAIIKQALKDADLYAKAKPGTYEVQAGRAYDSGEDVGELLVAAFYEWLDAGGAADLDDAQGGDTEDDYTVPAQTARSLLAAFG